MSLCYLSYSGMVPVFACSRCAQRIEPWGQTLFPHQRSNETASVLASDCLGQMDKDSRHVVRQPYLLIAFVEDNISGVGLCRCHL